MSTQRIPSASAVVPSTQVTNPEISVLDKTAQWHLAYERFNDHSFYKAQLGHYFAERENKYPEDIQDIIMGIYEQLLPLKGNDLIFEMFVNAVISDGKKLTFL
jgi:hypothetical protein